MRTYHKIQSVFKRDPDNNYKTFLFPQWSLDSFGYLANNEWEATEKIDGTNMRIGFSEDVADFVIGGRSDNAQIHADLYAHVDEIGKRGLNLGTLSGLTLFGEGYGAGIQKGGGTYRDDKGFILFDVQANESGLWLERKAVLDIGATLDIPVVRTAWRGSLNGAIAQFMDDEDIQSFEADREAEGWVLRTTTELTDRYGNRMITKLKVKDFPEERTQR